MKKLTTLFIIVFTACLFSIKVQAQSVDLGEYVPNNTITINGLHYLLDDKTMTAELLTLKKEMYGHITVPQYVTKKNKRYKVTSIYNYVFADQMKIISIELPEELDELKIGVFLQCRNLTSIKMPLRLNKLGSWCFGNCNNLTDITLPEGIEDIEDMTFDGCEKLRRLVIPKSVKRIRELVSGGGSSIKEVILLNPNTRIHKDAFWESDIIIKNWNGRTCKSRKETIKIIENGVVIGWQQITNEDED